VTSTAPGRLASDAGVADAALDGLAQGVVATSTHGGVSPYRDATRRLSAQSRPHQGGERPFGGGQKGGANAG